MTTQTVADYLKAGGRVTQCPAVDKPIKEPRIKVRVWHAPAAGHDREICARCDNRGRCEHPCAPLLWIDGRVERRETLLSRGRFTDSAADYKVVISEIAAHRDPPGLLDSVREIADIRTRLIALAILGWIDKADIIRHLHIPHRTFYRLLRGIKKAGAFRPGV